jgi:hypothetical protein
VLVVVSTTTTPQVVTTVPAPVTTPGVVDLNPGTPSGQIPGAHQDGADLYGIVLAFLVIAVAITAVRLIFRHTGRVTRQR